MKSFYDVIVIGAGHAGCEASAAAARMGVSVLLITMDLNKIAQMSCNPSVGGIAKGQIVREIDALGGFSAIVTDASTLQFRMLNRSKGPAVWSPRAQCDRMSYSQNWRWILENTPNLYMWQDTVSRFIFSDSGDKLTGLETSLGAKFAAHYYILTAGTFLDGRIFVGEKVSQGGRVAEPASSGLTDQIAALGIRTSRMKTGTPPRVDLRSVDLSMFSPQLGDPSPEKFSFLPYKSSVQRESSRQMPCYITHTNPEVHDILRSAFDRSPLFSGKIHGIGPRYCPSIEDKLRTFPDKESHQVFLEPEGFWSKEYYLQGFSSSLPFEVQLEALRHIKAFANVHLLRPAYAIEYDFFDPTQLDHTLLSKVVRNLYFAGQVNGTTGYEEAASQGLMAGINAALRVKEKDSLILTRDSSYIGVLIDDLVMKGVDEPYRMFTSRAEYRILLRQDNADERLTPIADKIGLISPLRKKAFETKKDIVNQINREFLELKLTPENANPFLESRQSSAIRDSKSLYELLSRPQLSIHDLYQFVPRGTRSNIHTASTIPLTPRDLFFPPTASLAASSPNAAHINSISPDFSTTPDAPAPSTSASYVSSASPIPAPSTPVVSAAISTSAISVPDNSAPASSTSDTAPSAAFVSAPSAPSVPSPSTPAISSPATYAPISAVFAADGSSSAVTSAIPVVSTALFALPIPSTFDISCEDGGSLLSDCLISLETKIKYSGYIEREIRQAEKIKRLEDLKIPTDFDYDRIGSLSIESRIKLNRHRPRTIAQASRIPGVSPADISALLIYFGR